MFNIFRIFGKPKSKTDEIKTQILLGMVSVAAAVGERVPHSQIKKLITQICGDWLPLLPESSITHGLPKVLAAYVLVASSQNLRN